MESQRASTTCRSPSPRRIGVEGRGGYYDRAGALRDMVQNHMLQLLCLVAMEPPTPLDADAVRDEKLKVLRALRRSRGADVELKTVRGQYRAGAIDGGAGAGLSRGDRRRPAAATETFVALKAEIDNWRWAGVPFYLRTGKRLPAARLGDRDPVPRASRTRSSARRPARSSPTGW